jgi:hypothetical protein
MTTQPTARRTRSTKQAEAAAMAKPEVPEVLKGVMAAAEAKGTVAKAAPKTVAKPAPAPRSAAAKAARAGQAKTDKVQAAEQPARTGVVEVKLSTGARLVPDRSASVPDLKVSTASADFLAWVAATLKVDLSKPLAPEVLAFIATRKPLFQTDIRDANPRARK